MNKLIISTLWKVNKLVRNKGRVYCTSPSIKYGMPAKILAALKRIYPSQTVGLSY